MTPLFLALLSFNTERIDFFVGNPNSVVYRLSTKWLNAKPCERAHQVI